MSKSVYNRHRRGQMENKLTIRQAAFEIATAVAADGRFGDIFTQAEVNVPK
jgi:hypothetical protein